MRNSVLVALGLILVSVVCWSSGANAADAKAAQRKALLKQFDANGNGKLGRLEKAAARPTIAKMRQQRAVRRNEAVVSGIK